MDTSQRDLWRAPERHAELEALLVENAGLPGPRANLRLAAAFADAVAAVGVNAARWRTLSNWIGIAAADAPTGDPREFLPFCALQALGALYPAADAARRHEIAALLRAAASDDRWRVRESVAIALQRVAEQRFADAQAIVADWLPDATLREQRAIVAALAHAPILRDPAAARYALDTADRILGNLFGLDAATRKREDFRVLRQALAYALSVLVAALPTEGFARLATWAAVDDADIARIVRANLAKARLAKAYPTEVQRVLAALEERSGGRT